MRRLIRFSTVCLQKLLLEFEQKWKIPPNNPKIGTQNGRNLTEMNILRVLGWNFWKTKKSMQNTYRDYDIQRDQTQDKLQQIA